MRAWLAAIFLFGQTVFALHHHEHSSAAAFRPAAAPAISHPDNASMSDGDDCMLCVAQAQPRAAALAPISAAAVFVPVVTLAMATVPTPRSRRAGRVSDRSPPVS